MKNRIIIVCLVLMSVLAHADELKDLLGDKVVEYQGVCRLNAQGMLVFTDKETKSAPECIVGIEKGKSDLKSILIFDEKGPVKLLEYSMKGKKQRTLWARGAI